MLMSLPQKEAAILLGRLPSKLIEAISIRIAQMDSVGGDEQEKVINEFLSSRTSALYASAGGLDRAITLIREALGKDAGSVLENLQQVIDARPFGFLKHVDPQTLLSFVTEEHPQTIAILLSHLPASYGAEVLSGLPMEKRMEVTQRVAGMGRSTPDAIADLEEGLESRLSKLMNQSIANVGGVETVAEILNVSERSVERGIMDHLAQEDPNLMDQIRRLMFVFEDIIKLSDRDVQTLLKNVESSQWAMALKGSSEALQTKVMGNMSARAADNLKEEMDFLGSVRVSEVEASQQKIVDVIRSLEDSGEISRPTADEEEQYVT